MLQASYLKTVVLNRVRDDAIVGNRERGVPLGVEIKFKSIFDEMVFAQTGILGDFGSATHSMRALCEAAGVPCRASGEWTERPIEILVADRIAITAEPGGCGKVRLELPANRPQEVARTALAILAYGLHDLVARQSIAGQTWSRATPPMGRPKAARAMTPKERQKIFRARKAGSLVQPGIPPD